GFSPAVKAAQTRYGAREHGVRTESKDPVNDRLTDELITFVGGVNSFFIGTTSREGWPHVQHRGGPPGFLKVLDDRTLVFPDYAGNKQYITVGNLSENNRAFLFLIDYERPRRLKLWGFGTVLDGDQALIELTHDAAYGAKVEREIRFDLQAW